VVEALVEEALVVEGLEEEDTLEEEVDINCFSLVSNSMSFNSRLRRASTANRDPESCAHTRSFSRRMFQEEA